MGSSTNLQMPAFGMPKSRAALIVAVLLVGLSHHPARAQMPSPFASWQNDSGIVLRDIDGPIPDWDVVLGGGVDVSPNYVGSDHYELMPEPVIDVRYKDWAFLSTGEGLGVNLLHGRNYRAGIEVGYDTGRSQHDQRALNGTGSIPPAPIIRAFGEYAILPVVIKADLGQALGGVDGLVGNLGVYLPVVGNEKLVVFVGPAVTLANDRYMQRYFGINTTQAIQNSRFPLYRAHAGFANANFGVTAIYHITDHWLVDCDLAYERLLDSAADSPIVENPNQLGGSLNVDYEF